MSKYMIHTMPKRRWYVDEYLIPSMLKQGIQKDDIQVFEDTEELGNLRACMYSFLKLKEEGNTWHLQDDIIVSKDFKEQTEKHEGKNIVCGFCSDYDKTTYGKTNVKDMWFSFPCIKIPNSIARECAEWILKYIIGNMVYAEWWKDGVNDDMLFRKFMQEKYKEYDVLNLAPNIVDHIDYLIGGTVNNQRQGGKVVRSKFWDDENAIKTLKKQLKIGKK